jgi:hypothetical protein
MKKWFWAAAVCQFITAIFHSLSFLSESKPVNATERQLQELMNNYEMNLGGMYASMQDLFNALSSCFSLLCFFGGLLNVFLLRRTQELNLLRGVIGINLLVFGGLFIIMAALTFLPPIVCTGAIFLCLLVSFGLSLPLQAR